VLFVFWWIFELFSKVLLFLVEIYGFLGFMTYPVAFARAKGSANGLEGSKLLYLNDILGVLFLLI